MKTLIYIITTTLLIFADLIDVKAEKRSKALRTFNTVRNSPIGFTYQAAIRDDSGNPLANTPVVVRLSIQTAADASETLEWEETHSVSTNDFGLLNVIVGQGNQTGGNQNDFASVPWGSSDMFLKVEIDQGSGFVDLGTNQLLSVPYALSASNGISDAQTQKLSSINDGAEKNVQVDWTITDNTSDGFILNKPSIPVDLNELTDTNNLLGGGFSGNFSDLSNVPAGLVDGDDVNDADADATNEIQDLQLSGNTLTITNNGSAASIDLSAYLDDTDTQLTESEVDGFVANNGYLTSEVDGDATNEIQDLQLSGNTLTITNNGSATLIDLSDYLDDTDTQLTESEVDGFVANNGYLTSEVDGDASNEIQDLQLSGNTLTITNNGSATSIDLSAYLDDTDTQLTESEVDGFVANNGYLTSEVDGDASNEIQDLQLVGNMLTITNNGSATSIDLSAYLDDTDTQLTESEVDGFVANNGYLTSEVDGDASNEIQDLQLLGNTLTITNNGSATSIDLSAYLDDTDTQLTESEVDGFVANNGYLTSEVDGDPTNEIQDLQLVGNMLTITNNGSATSIDLSAYLDDTDTQLTESEVDGFVANNGYLTSEVDGDPTNEIQDLEINAGILSITNNSSASNIDLSNYDSDVSDDFSGNYNDLTNKPTTIESFYGTGVGSLVGGVSVYAESFGEFSIGTYSTRAASPTSDDFIATDRLFTIGNGSSIETRSDALVMLKNGNTDLNGEFVANSLGVDGVFTLPISDGTSGQILSTNGSGVISWANIDYNNLINLPTNLDTDATDDFSGNYNDLTNKPTITNYSSTGTNSFVAGFFNIASNQNGFVGGGSGNNNSGYGATISGGDNNTASDQNASIGGGRSNTASSAWATISGGDGNTASNLFASVTGGRYNTSSGWASAASGRSMYAESFGEFAIGVYGTRATSPSANSSVGTDRLFVIGNGAHSGALSDALVMLKNGNTDINGVLVANSLGIDGAFTLPTSDGTSGQVLSTNGSGTVSWSTIGAGPTIVTSSATTVTIPDNTKDYMLSHSGTATLTVTMPSSNTAGDQINISSSNSGFGSMALVFSGTASIRQSSTGSVSATLNDSNSNISMIYDGSTWLVISGALTFLSE